jgi:hypothetical protein
VFLAQSSEEKIGGRAVQADTHTSIQSDVSKRLTSFTGPLAERARIDATAAAAVPSFK